MLVLERLDHTGGAATSRYSSHVSLPDQLVRDLELDVELRPRAVSSYTPYLRAGRHGGLLVESPEGDATRASFAELTGGDEEYAAWRELHARFGSLAKAVEATLLDPLPRERDIEGAVDPSVWSDFVLNPIGQVLLRTFRDDLVRGVVASDAVVGAFVSPDDSSLVANRLFLSRLMGERRVPVGGMDAFTVRPRAGGARGGCRGVHVERRLGDPRR